VHVHVPGFAESLGVLGTTQAELATAIPLLRGAGCRHYEVETYAWNVLPPDHAADDLAEGIAHELNWVRGNAGALA